MTFPVYGIYSGGSPVLYSYFEQGFFILLVSAIAIKSAAYASFARGNWGRLFAAMVIANGVTTCLGFILEGVQAFTLALLFAPAILALLILYVATKILRSGGALTFLGSRGSLPFSLLLTAAFLVTTLLGFVPGAIPESSDWRFVWKCLYAWSALAITLFVTSGYEFGVIRALSRQDTPPRLAPVLKANLLVFFLLFLAATGVLVSRKFHGNRSTDPHAHAAIADWFGR